MWVDIDRTALMDIAWLDELWQYQQRAKAALEAYGISVAQLTPIDISAGYAQQPYPAYINMIERNIDVLYARVYWVIPENRGVTREWLGELMDTPLLDYSDVNRWFGDTDWIRYTAESYGVLGRISGAFTSGPSHGLQHIRYTRR